MQAEPHPNRPDSESSQETASAGNETEGPDQEAEESRTGAMKIVKKLFQMVCLAALFLSAGFLIYHMVYLPMENRKLVAELKGNFPDRKSTRLNSSHRL